jgi:hypothetical protein
VRTQGVRPFGNGAAIVNGRRVARSPIHPADIRPANFIGSLVPGSGDFANGNVAEGSPGFPGGFKENQGIHREPRIGFAYDLTGDGKTCLHASAATFVRACWAAAPRGTWAATRPSCAR